MGLKQITVLLVVLLSGLRAQSQSSIDHFDVVISWEGESDQVDVSERMQFSRATNETEITVQALAFENSTIQNLLIRINNNAVPAVLSKNKNGLWVTTIPVEALNTLEVNYETSIVEKQIIAPLLFTPIVPPSSDEQLFSATLKIPAHHKLVESFPTINDASRIEGTQEIYNVKLPVIPSVVKFEVAPEAEFKLGITEILDGVILVTLTLLGVVGWRNRKMLT